MMIGGTTAHSAEEAVVLDVVGLFLERHSTCFVFAELRALGKQPLEFLGVERRPRSGFGSGRGRTRATACLQHRRDRRGKFQPVGLVRVSRPTDSPTCTKLVSYTLEVDQSRPRHSIAS